MSKQVDIPLFQEYILDYGPLAELVYARVSGARLERGTGSSPARPTTSLMP